MENLSYNSDNVVKLPVSLESRLQALEAGGNLTDEAIDQALVEILVPLRLQASRVLAAMKAIQLDTNFSGERHVGLVETRKEG